MQDRIKIEINGDQVEYERVGSRPSGKRVVLVVDRGWIYAGDVEDRDGRIILTRAVWVFSWRHGKGFDTVLKDPKADKVDIRVLEHDVDVPAGAEIFRIPVSDDWGLL